MSWPLVRLGDIFEITSSKRVHQKDWRTEGIPFYRAREIAVLSREGEVDNDLFIDEPMYEEYKSKFGAPEEGDILVTAVGTLGLTYAVKKGERFYFKDASVIKLRKKIDVDISYIQYAIASPKVQGFIQNSSGATVGTYTISRARETEIPLPPLDEQKRIAAILDKADAIRRKRKQAIDLADDFLRSVFLDMFGDPVTNPKGWDKCTVADIAKFIGGYAFKSKDYSNSGVPLVKITNVHFDKVDWDDKTFLPVNIAESKPNFLLKEGDLVMAMTRPVIKSLGTVKLVEIQKSDLPCLLNQRVGKFEFVTEEVNKTFFKQFLMSEYFKNEVEKLCSVALQPNVSSKQIEAVNLYFPPLELQEKFSKIQSQVIKKLSKSRHTNQLCENVFKSLSQQAFAGEL